MCFGGKWLSHEQLPVSAGVIKVIPGQRNPYINIFYQLLCSLKRCSDQCKSGGCVIGAEGS